MQITFTRCGDSWSEDTRITNIKQVIVAPGIILYLLALILLALGGTALAPSVAGAGRAGMPDGPAQRGAAAIGVVPADGKPRGIRLRSQTVNTVISEDAAGVWADTDLQVQLQNRGNDQVVLPVAIPGPQVTAYVTATLDLPQVLDVVLDQKALALVPIENARQPTVRASTVITVPAQASVTLRIRYRQAVPVRDDLAAYSYPLQGGGVWAGAPESLRVTIAFKVPIAGEQLLHLTPGAAAPRPGVHTWKWQGVKAPTNIAVAFVSSEWWRGLEADRAAAAGGADLAKHTALAERYWRLATLAPPAFAPYASLYEPNLPLAVAAWRTGIASAKADTPRQELARAHERLAGIYLAEASRAGRERAQIYRQLAADELAQAVVLDPSDPDRVSSATHLQSALYEAAARRGDRPAAAEQLARVQALARGQAAPSPEEARQTTALALAEAALGRNDFGAARRVLQEAYGAEALESPGARPPAVTQALLEIDSRLAGRRISLRLVDGDDGRAAARLVAETAAALVDVAPVTTSGTALTITLAYTDPAAIVATQSRLAAALPRVPELALLASALTSRRLAWPQNANLVARTSRYEERVDLARSVATWMGEAEKLEAAAAKAGFSGLDAVKARLWRADARAWRDLAALSRATYRVVLEEQGAGPEWLLARVHQFYREGSIAREWVVRAGETRQLEAAVLGWRYDRLALAAGAALALAALAVGIAWLVAR